MTRFSQCSNPICPLVAILAALSAHVDVTTKALWRRLARIRQARDVGLDWLTAVRISRVGVLSGGATLSEGQHAGEFILTEAYGRSRDNVTVLSGQTLKAGAVVGRVALGVGSVAVPVVVGTGTGTVTLVSAGPEVEVGSYVLKCITAVAHGGVFSLTSPSGKRLPDLTMTPGSGGTTVYKSRHINFSITDSADFIVDDTFTFIVGTTVPVVVGTGDGVISALSLGPQAKPGTYLVLCIVAATNAATWELFDPDGQSLGVRSYDGSGATAVWALNPQLNLTITDGSTDFATGAVFNVAVFNQLGGGKAVAWDPLTYDGRHRAVGCLYDNVDAALGDLAGVIITRDAEVNKSDLQWGAAISAADKESAYLDLAARQVIAR